jgi:hypothetical protein
MTTTKALKLAPGLLIGQPTVVTSWGTAVPQLARRSPTSRAPAAAVPTNFNAPTGTKTTPLG